MSQLPALLAPPWPLALLCHLVSNSTWLAYTTGSTLTFRSALASCSATSTLVSNSAWVTYTAGSAQVSYTPPDPPWLPVPPHSPDPLQFTGLAFSFLLLICLVSTTLLASVYGASRICTLGGGLCHDPRFVFP
ncbi:hypothetical protein ROHU_014063 [Labeo rohita]|uniref:Uncharacterized protein n=1 Tax=Labeo rohita TaxID=84645 RepID=A0A498NZ37_LABRO|nr:hypothetical protein ROHU_014063 [Labeo rohita]